MPETSPLLIRTATLAGGTIADVRIAQGRIVEIGALDADFDGPVIDAGGGLLIPGLHDHHLHLAATAAARSSVRCGPPDVVDEPSLARALARPGAGWLRGVGYHESVAGMLDRQQLDRLLPDRPLRIQHRSGRMWFLNSAGLDRLLESGIAPPPGLDRSSGQLFDADLWMRQAIGGQPPALAELGAALARLGITGVTDMGAGNGPEDHAALRREQTDGALLQRLMLAGTEGLSACAYDAWLMLGPVKVHLHEADLPPHDALVARIAAAHRQDRGVAVHCVTLVELVYALAALRDAHVHPADRIEHAAVASDAQVAEMAALGLPVAVQPLFVFERGDTYRHDIAESEWPQLYRLRGFVSAGVPLVGSSDAPYVDIDPWAAMTAAVGRATRAGDTLGVTEALLPDEALNLYLADPSDLRRHRTVAVGVAADLCLLDKPWAMVRDDLCAEHVRLTLIEGRAAYDRDGLLTT